MRIKKIELCGFKSFKDRTVIQLDAGITGIVGPNGCGKSNIIDALLWVMGEQSAKHLRGNSMEDVIFGGAEGYAPGGMAEVSLVLENDGGPFPAKWDKYSEVQVTRRLHRSGESEYLINKEASRLRDIQEIFMDTGAGAKGFSIIEQGAIGKIISAKPEDRRVLIEEAAGITKFKARKKESQRKLANTEQNLIRIFDITAELKRQLDSLQRQAKRAERYREMKNQIEDLDLFLSSRKYKDLNAEKERLASEVKDLDDQIQSAVTDISRLEAEIEGYRLGQTEKEKLVNHFQAKLLESKSLVQGKEGELQKLRIEIEQTQKSAQMQTSLKDELEARRKALVLDRQRLEVKLGEVNDSFQNLDEKRDDLELQYRTAQDSLLHLENNVEEDRKRNSEITRLEFENQTRVENSTEKAANFESQLNESKAVLVELTPKKKEFENRRNTLRKTLETERQLQLSIMNDVENFESNREQLNSQFEQKSSELEEIKDRLNSTKSRLYGLENMKQNFEGFEVGVKNVLKWNQGQSEEGSEPHFVPFSNIVDVPREYEIAVESVLGNSIQTLVSNSDGDSKTAIEYLKSQSVGRSGFISKSTVSNEDPIEESGMTRLTKIVRFKEGYEKAGEALFRNVGLTDSIDAALEFRNKYPNWTFVTREGDFVSPQGVITGGSKDSAESGVLKREREIKELKQLKDELEGKYALAQVSVEKMSKTLKALEGDIENAQKSRNEKEILIVEVQKDLERAEREFSNVIEAIEKQEQDRERFESLLNQERKYIQECNENIEKLKVEKEEVAQRLSEFEVSIRTARQNVENFGSDLTDIKVQIASGSKEKESIEAQMSIVSRSIDDVVHQIDRMEVEKAKSVEFISQNEFGLQEACVELESLISATEQSEKQLAEARDEFEKYISQYRDEEERLSVLRKSKSELSEKLNESQVHLKESELNTSYLIDQVSEKYEVCLNEVFEKYMDREEDPKESESRLKDLKSKILKIGEVNVSAIDEYDELKERYEFLSQQQEDLVKSKDQLKKVIDRINRICTKRFNDTYHEVNSRFQKVFPVLFGGGEARLELVENEDKSEAGLNIVARPPGKKLQNISLMSGGEKALTSVALIFSIFLVKPSPFCLLDEVDAPLDDANVARFNDLVREMAKRSQIIVVTHNKYTMEINEKLFGVTMQEKGVSKMVSVSLQEAKEVVTQ